MFEGPGGGYALQGTSDALDLHRGDAGVDGGGGDILVAEEFLNVPQVGAVFEEVGGKAVAEVMAGGLFTDTAFDEGVLEDLLDGSNREVLFPGGVQ